MPDLEQMREYISELKRYADLDRTEFGEACMMLANLRRRGDCLSDATQEALEREIQQKLQWYENNTEIKTTESTQSYEVLIRNA